MPSDGPHRLHPASILFNLAGPLKALIIPAGLVALPTRDVGPDGFDGAWWAALALAISAVSAVVKYVTFRYEYGDTELVIRAGLFFRSERHIPYGRIQNIDGRQHLLHRLLGVQTIVIETGGGSEAEATLSVLDEGALDEMRRRVSAGAGAAGVPATGAATGDATSEAAGVPLLRLGLRDLVICGLVRGRGWLLALAAAGLALEYGALDRVAARWGVDAETSGSARDLFAALVDRAAIEIWHVAAAVAAGVIVLLVMRLLAMALTIVRLYGFTLVDDAGKLRMTYGLLTRVRAVIPVARIQSLAMREGPLHRFSRTTSVRADTAGGEGDAERSGSREWLAPIIARDAAAPLVARLMPGVDLSGAAPWRPPHPRARRRAFTRSAVTAAVVSLPALWYFQWAAAPFVAALLAFAWWESRLQIRHMALAVTPTHLMFRSGWLWRQMTIAPLDKVQAVALSESPFDRRHGMASLIVDTAGASGAPHRLDVPWLALADAEALSRVVAGGAARSAFRW